MIGTVVASGVHNGKTEIRGRRAMKFIGHCIFSLIFIGGGLVAWTLPNRYAWVALILVLVWFPVARWMTAWILYWIDRLIVVHRKD